MRRLIDGLSALIQQSFKLDPFSVSMPNNVIKGSFATPEAVAYIMTQKFVMGSPLYRMEQEFKRDGIMLSRQTMSNWLLKASADWLEPLYKCLYELLLKETVLHADETTLQVLHEDGKKAQTKSYMWLYRTSGCCERTICMTSSRTERHRGRRRSLMGSPDTCMPTDTQDTTVCPKTSW